MPLAEPAGNAAARGNAIGAKIPRPRSASSQPLVYRCVQPCDVRAKPGKGARVGALEAGQEVAVAEIAKAITLICTSNRKGSEPSHDISATANCAISRPMT